MAEAVKLTANRRWVLSHWRDYGWSIAPDRLRTKKSEADLARLVKDGLLEQEAGGPFNPMCLFRITEAGRRALILVEDRKALAEGEVG